MVMIINTHAPCCVAFTNLYSFESKLIFLLGRREVQALQVKCDTYKLCTWTGTVDKLDKHLDMCAYALVPCPNHCEDGGSISKINNFFRKNISMHLKEDCPNYMLPCPSQCRDFFTSKVHQFKRKNLDFHLKKDCPNFEVPCPRLCREKITRKDLNRHITRNCPNRDFKCKYCGEKDTYHSITGTHDRVCRKKILHCSNAGCPATMERQELNDHVKSRCDYTVVCCKYKDTCDKKMKRKHMAAHKELHVSKALRDVSELKEARLAQASLNDQYLKEVRALNEAQEKLVQNYVIFAREVQDAKLELERSQTRLSNCVTAIFIFLCVIFLFCVSFY